MSDAPIITYTARADTKPDAELDALAAVYKFVLSHSQASRGGPHDLTNHPTKECTTRQDMKGTGNADVHGD
jgi:hypothetical protein